MHYRSKQKTESSTPLRVEPITAGKPAVTAKFATGGVYWIRPIDRRILGSTDWQIARQCFDDKFMVIGMLVILSMEDIAEIGPLVLPPCSPATSAYGSLPS